MLNLDSEDEGELYIGCAGGEDLSASLEYKEVETDPEDVALKVTLKGLRGGHSGLEINEGRANANKLMARFVSEVIACDEACLVSVWVAYPLCKMYTVKNVDREDAEIWDRDPYLGSNSSAPFGGYGGDYDRGHQLPFADRSCCLEAGMQTFYGSNMTPQDNTLNTGIWAAFENKVRTWANSSDTLYVVTGCVVKNPLGYTTDSSNKRMTVPSAYFKALLKYSKASTLGQWNAAGFIKVDVKY